MSKNNAKIDQVPIWTITFEGDPGTSDDYQVEFFDISDIVKGLCLVSKYLDLVGDLQEKHDHYITSADIKYVNSELTGDMSDNFFLVIFAEGKNGNNIGLLLAEHEDGQKYPLIAIWPYEIYQKVKDDENFLDQIINDIIEKPDMWKKVEVILPIDD
ncbi:MAG: hypothetical protein ACTSWR_02995 [Candidatus Helarchaeota archaeon]